MVSATLLTGASADQLRLILSSFGAGERSPMKYARILESLAVSGRPSLGINRDFESRLEVNDSGSGSYTAKFRSRKPKSFVAFAILLSLDLAKSVGHKARVVK